MRGFAVLGEGQPRRAWLYEKGARRAALFVWGVGRASRGGGRFIAGDCGGPSMGPAPSRAGARRGQPFGCPDSFQTNPRRPLVKGWRAWLEDELRLVCYLLRQVADLAFANRSSSIVAALKAALSKQKAAISGFLFI